LNYALKVEIEGKKIFFFPKIMDYASGWSKAHNQESVNFIPVSEEPTITLKLETSAYNWARPGFPEPMYPNVILTTI